MSDEEPVAPPAADPEPATPGTRSRWRRAPLVALAIVVAIVAGVLVSVLTVDLGPNVLKRAEVEGSKYIERPIHIGRIVAKLIPGVFEFHDLVIEGLSPTDRPFLKAKRITVALPWWTIITRKMVIESVEMTDWDMVIETWPSSPGFPNGRHSFPKFVHERKPSGPKRFNFTTTLQWMLASRGAFTYEDHGTPWSTAASGVRIAISRGLLDTVYRGRASFADSTIRIQAYEPFHANMQSQFIIDKSNMLRFSRMDLLSDGARTAVTGVLDMAHWPEQTYQLTSDIDFPTQKEIFFHGQRFATSGRGLFLGTFHLFKGGRELKGTFTSPLAGVLVGGQDWRFPNLRGSVLWLPDRLEITDATSGLHGGNAAFDYRLAPFGKKDQPTMATWDVKYRDVDLSRLTDFLQTPGLRLAGRITGRNRLVWPLGKWSEKIGAGEVTAAAPGGVRMMTRELQADAVKAASELPIEAGPFNPRLSLGYLPLSGHITYAIDPAWITLDKSWTATEKTYVEFDGRTAYGDRSRIPFHVTSLDWQESDRVLAGIMTAFGSPTGAIPIGGHGEFDGVMLEAFARPRIEGTFSGDRMRAWDVDWGRGRATLVIENSYVDIADSVITKDGAEITADGRFSLGYPRRDNGEEINARVRLTRRPLVDLRHAFELDDYPVEGLLSGEFHVYGKYEGPLGFGRMVIDRGVAYGETFETATSGLRFEGTGVRLDTIDIRKSTGAVTGAAWVGWDGNYSFNADGAKIPVESLALATFKRAPLSGILQFTASGTGTFEVPRYDVRARVDDLFAGDEGIGQLTGRLGLRGELLTIDFEAASQRLQASGSGRIAMTEEMDAELTLRFRDTSLDPYVRFFEPRLSPFTNAVAAGTVRVIGELSDVDHLVVDAKVDQLDLKLFDYRLSNDGVIDLALDQHTAEIRRLRLVGDGTQLELGGSIGLHDSTIAVQASGDANLGILQGFFRDLRSSGAATLKAQIDGPLGNPVFSGSAAITNGRIRASTFPSLDAINGRVLFDASGARIDDVKARLGAGEVTIAGSIGANGFALGDVNLTAVGQQVTLRYPEGFRSIVDADLTLRGPFTSLELGGLVVVRDAVYSKRFETNADIFSLTGASAVTPSGAAAAPSLPVRFNIDIQARQSLRIENNIARIVSSADLRLQGTLDRPVLFGQAEVDRGSVVAFGNRYLVTRGTIGFSNPMRIEPYFDIEAETRIRQPLETYRITIGLMGTPNRVTASFDSDPPLSHVDIFSLVLGQQTDLENAELRTLSSSAASRAQDDFLKAAMARLLTSSLSAPVGRVFEQALGVDLLIAPSLGSGADPLSASARVVVGRRLSERAYVTLTHALGTQTVGTAPRDQIVLEIDQNERIGYVLTQNSDGTFSVDFRVRHVIH